jgi:lia operon protein LiaG
MPRFPVLSCLLLALPLMLQAQTERYTLEDGPVAVYNLVGNLRVEPGDAGVIVQVTRAGRDAGQLKVAQGEIDGRSTLRVIYPGDRILYGTGRGNGSTTLRVRDDGTFGDPRDEHDHGRHMHFSEAGRRVTISSAGGGLDARADLLVRVPRGRRVDLMLAVGSVALANVDGDIAVDAHDAAVTATGAKGTLDIDVGSGTVRASDVQGDLSVDTGSGSVEVSRLRGQALSIDTGSGDVTGTELESDKVAIETGSGEIRLTGISSPHLSLETGSGGVTADLRHDVASLQVETGSGDIAIRAPASLGAELDLQTSSGDIETDFPLQVTRRGRDHVEGTVGDGKGTIAIETGSGGIRLLKN